MTENKGKETPQNRPAEEEDVEGHMMVDPSGARVMARVRSRELERQAREHKQAKEAKR